MCVQQRLWSNWASVWSDWADAVFTGRTCHFVGFVTMRLKYTIRYQLHKSHLHGLKLHPVLELTRRQFSLRCNCMFLRISMTPKTANESNSSVQTSYYKDNTTSIQLLWISWQDKIPYMGMGTNILLFWSGLHLAQLRRADHQNTWREENFRRENTLKVAGRQHIRL